MTLIALMWFTASVDVATAQSDVLWQQEVATIPASVQQAEAEYHADADNLESATQLLRQYVKQARQRDDHEFVNRANQLIKNVSERFGKPQAEYWQVAVADAWQYQHQFERAQRQLQSIGVDSQFYTRASLMLSRIALTVGNTSEAQSYCNRLMGQASLGVVATCLLEVKGRQGQLTRAYTELKILQQRSADQPSDDKITRWRLQILTEQALLLRRYSEAQQWISLMPGELSVVDQKRQLDSYLMNDKGAVPKSLMRACDADVVDSIAIRLALAQKQMDGAGCWLDYAAERIKLRERRGDKLHSADIAYYYIYVSPDAEKANYWAKTNYQVAKEPLDQALLQDAQQLLRL